MKPGIDSDVTQEVALKRHRESQNVLHFVEDHFDFSIDEEEYNNVLLPLTHLVDKRSYRPSVRSRDRTPPWLASKMVKVSKEGDPANKINSLSIKLPSSMSSGSSVTLPDSLGTLGHLSELNIEDGWIERLPSSLSRLQNLKKLYVMALECEERLDVIASLVSLEQLKLRYVTPSLLPRNISALHNLRVLDLTQSPISQLPEDFGRLRLTSFHADFWRFELGSVDKLMGLAASLEDLDMGDRQSEQNFEPFLSQLTQLIKLRCPTQYLPCFPPEILGPDSHMRELVAFHQYGDDNLEANLLLLHQWSSLTCLHLQFHGEQDHPNVLNGLFSSLHNLQKLWISDYSRGGGISQLSLRDLVNLTKLTSLRLFCSFNLSGDSDPDQLQQKIVLPSLENLFLSKCNKDKLSLIQILDLPRLKEFSLKFGQLDTAGFEDLWSSWLRNFKSLKSMCFRYNRIGAIQSNVIHDMATHGIMKLDLELNGFWDWGSRSDQNVSEERLVSLMQSCPSLSCIGNLPSSPKARYLLCLAAARNRVLGNQFVAPSLWPKVFAHSLKAFSNETDAASWGCTFTVSRPDAIYTLLRERAALELFGSS